MTVAELLRVPQEAPLVVTVGGVTWTYQSWGAGSVYIAPGALAHWYSDHYSRRDEPRVYTPMGDSPEHNPRVVVVVEPYTLPLWVLVAWLEVLR